MIVYNVTVKVEPGIADAWLYWLQTEHAPEMLATNCFSSYKIVRLLDVEDSDGPTYAVQYYTDSVEKYRDYVVRYAAGIQQKAFARWGDRFIAFRTLMEEI